MASLEGTLANIPGLAGYLASQQNRQQQSNSELQGLAGQMGLLQAIQKQQQEAKSKLALEQAGGDPAKAVEALLKSGNAQGAARLAPLLKQQNTGFTLGEGQQRFDVAGKPIASVAPKVERPEARPEILKLQS